MNANPAMFAGIINGWEVLLIIAVVLILFSAKRASHILEGLHRGFSEFFKAINEMLDRSDQEAKEAGRSIGGIYGKPAAQVLTPDNQTAELYDPAVFGRSRRHHNSRITLLLLKAKRLFQRIFYLAGSKLRSLLSGGRSN